MPKLATNYFFHHSALSEPRNTKNAPSIWGSIGNVLGYTVSQRGLSRRKTVETLEKEVVVITLFFDGGWNQSLIQLTSEHHVPSARAGFCAACLFATETAIADQFSIPRSLLLVVIDPHSLNLANSESRATQDGIGQSLLLGLKKFQVSEAA
jgi:hypothetical protein